MVPITDLSHLSNPLVSSEQLETSASQLDGVPKDLEDSVRFESARQIQAAGILLRLPQDLIAQSIVILCRFWTGPEGGSLLDHDSKVRSLSYLCLCISSLTNGNPGRCCRCDIRNSKALRDASITATNIDRFRIPESHGTQLSKISQRGCE